MAASLSNAVSLPDVQFFRQFSRDELVSCLEMLHGTKDLVLEASLMRPLDRIAGASLLKQHGVDKIFKFDKTPLKHGNDQRLYLVRPEIDTVKAIADHINSDKSARKQRTYKIVFVPQKTFLCEKLLEDEGVYGYVSTDVFNLRFIPLDTDILSLELPQFFRSFFLDGDQTWLKVLAKSVQDLECVFGAVPSVYIQGNASKMVYDLTQTLEELEGAPRALKNEIGHMFLLDRDIDYVTPMCSQLAYEGLLDEALTIKSGYCDLGPEVVGQDNNARLLLTSQDEIFDEIRDRHFSNVWNFFSAKAKELAADYEQRNKLASVSDMKDFVSNKLKALKQQHKSLAMHISASEYIVNSKSKTNFEDQLKVEHSLLEGIEIKENISCIEEAINRQYPVANSLRLLCLLSLVLDGLPKGDYWNLQTQFLQSHGYKHLSTFFNLKKLGLFTCQEKASSLITGLASIPRSSTFQTLCRKLNLIPKSGDEVNLKNPKDMSYVFSGAYTPLTCRLVEKVLSKEGFDGLDDVIKLLPGINFCNIKAKSLKGKPNNQHESSRVVLVFFVGGCTYAEIAALRLLGKLKGYRFIIATTAIITGARLLQSVMEQ